MCAGWPPGPGAPCSSDACLDAASVFRPDRRLAWACDNGGESLANRCGWAQTCLLRLGPVTSQHPAHCPGASRAQQPKVGTASVLETSPCPQPPAHRANTALCSQRRVLWRRVASGLSLHRPQECSPQGLALQVLCPCQRVWSALAGALEGGKSLCSSSHLNSC